MYDPKVGRWLSEDPIGFEAGDFNLTRYVSNAPTSNTDPSGLEQKPRPFQFGIDKGTETNHFQGTGEWRFENYDQMYKFFENLAKHNKWPWPLKGNAQYSQIERGCIGLLMFRFRYFQYSPDKRPHFPEQIPGAVLFDTFEAAQEYLTKVTEEAARKGDDTKYLIFASQHAGATIQKKPGRNRINEHQVFADELVRDRRAEDAPGSTYNFATWLPLESGGGIWEFMEHDFLWSSLAKWPDKKEDCPVVKHVKLDELPTGPIEGIKYGTLYGVAPINKEK